MKPQEARQRMMALPRAERDGLNRMRQQGYHYYIRGEQGGNPYPKDSDEYAAWVVGYFDAVEDNS